MRTFFLFFFCSMVVSGVFGDRFSKYAIYQNRYTEQELAQKIAKYLEKDPGIRRFYRLTPSALYLGEWEKGEVDYVLYLRDIATGSHCKKPRRESLQGVKIALDPGHFGGKYAKIEERFVDISGEETLDGQAIFFCEGDISYLTAVFLKELLEKAGAEVFITRQSLGEGAFDEDFFSWLEKQPDLQHLPLSTAFRAHYNPLDLMRRAEAINAFSPDITVALHYNVDIDHQEQEYGKFFTHWNYSLAFIPGAFQERDLESIEHREAFLRLLVTDDLANSCKLTRSILRFFEEVLQVPLMDENYKPFYVKNACLLQEKGMYSRSLFLTRLVRSPICYGETLIQNNQEEAYRLQKTDTEIKGVSCSSRLKEVAKAYFQGIQAYFLD